MFYSHEILNSHKHGVSTIWLVATIGNRSSTRKVTKKAIQGVNVEKACGTILEPGAPIALRLQGNLLYGVSRVYNQQCDYMLSDAQKVHANMEFFFRRLGAHELDMEQAKSRPDQLLIMNDPDFVPELLLPKFDLEANVVNSQLTTKTTSQLSPAESSFGSLSSDPRAFPIQLDLSQSLTPDHRVAQFPGLEGLSSAHKSHVMPGDEKLTALPGIEDDFGGIEEWGVEIDEFGNISTREEPDLPPMFQAELPAATLPAIQDEEQEAARQHDDFVFIDNEALLDAPALPGRTHEEPRELETVSSQMSEKAPAKKQKKPRKVKIDDANQIARVKIGAWQDDYIQNCGAKLTKPAGIKQARENAIHLTFGLGLGNVGQSLGVLGMIHPLAVMYSGDSLYTTLTGYEVDTLLGKRRSTREPSGDSDEIGRRVRPRLNDLGEHGLDNYNTDAGQHVFDDDAYHRQAREELEVGREAQAAMSDAPSSAMRMPWARDSSVVPGSSVKGHGSAQRSRHKLVSPSQGRGHLPDIERLSDDAQGGWRDDAGDLPSFDGSFDGAVGRGHSPAEQDEPGNMPQGAALRTTLDVEGQEFFDFMEAAIELNGERLDDDKSHESQHVRSHKWMRFDDAFVPEQTARTVAARAFYNVLCLATKSQIMIRTSEMQPPGQIWLGMQSVSTTATQQANP
ncbi:Rec8 like protein-domain-containing protein [Microdochium trichocladiopsis]|uniref:Rec8 like protein-domain-containing protein n=1 Tax=Microdochium trichocladiopsis TaxID=1682393 RepID=A0A9P8YB61_9PEZI|nr:Rec8 like protein-domain-containing protein [Microdochium trichocladiopsis]KAH7037456.1 Rec8 like protein-domain-containing protein [Microdochium trichocladiopsis]